MSMRCANCGSKRITPVSKKDSFSMGKAVAGTVLFGPAGAVMGVNGKETQGYYCSTCGVTLDHTMMDITANHIDNLIQSGYAELLSIEKQTYWGIEWEPSNSKPISSFSQNNSFDNKGSSNTSNSSDISKLEQAKQAIINFYEERGLKDVETRILKNYLDSIGLSEYFSEAINNLQENGRILYFDGGLINEVSYYSDPAMIESNKALILSQKIFDQNTENITNTVKKLLTCFPYSEKIPYNTVYEKFFPISISNGWAGKEILVRFLLDRALNECIYPSLWERFYIELPEHSYLGNIEWLIIHKNDRFMGS